MYNSGARRISKHYEYSRARSAMAKSRDTRKDVKKKPAKSIKEKKKAKLERKSK